ncbi:hypothetical protein BBBOND_0102820 [Babesia bigemina]|uniref:Ubiquinone biosynthesis O-methyltransferase, mitochondrial n=1 Tax=Babesia bigemina TaxID=5866 RepID=A0A061CZW6_BABBI|nr:hypothetical protein BBBOND_0102820 [Babesia bigemina]CDR93958.1 hypothetical protein BBBOND_0102820 [Babesia bigemina]|eukprot:XP_012766144.1 hypothetical protein BBBOND_0102820 [Babesia bigemina]
MLRHVLTLSSAPLNLARGAHNSRSFSSAVNFGAFHAKWWDIDGPMAVLHDYNYVRVPFIAKSYSLLENSNAAGPTPEPKLPSGFLSERLFKHAEERSKIHLETVLGGLRVLDVGCGGGILSESLAKSGAHVVGLDPSRELIQVAEHHREQDFATFSKRFGLRDDRSKNVQYLAWTLDDFASSAEARNFDIVVASEVLEHVPNSSKPSFVEQLSRVARPGGLVVITTPGRTLKSCLVNIVLAERVFQRVAPGTHQYDLFIAPDKLREIARDHDLTEIHRQGLFYLPFSRRFIHLCTCDFLYMIAFRKRPGEPFDPCHDSRIATNPVCPTPISVMLAQEYSDSTTPPEPPRCAVCSSQLTFLIQLGTPYRDTHVRTLYVYFCPAHSEQSEGWRVFRYTVAKQVVQVQKQSAFDEMNSLSSWVDDLQLFPTGPVGGKQKSASRAARSADDDNEAYRVLVEEDFLTPLSFPVGGPEASRLFEAYKQRDPADVDEEDHMDLDAIRQTTSAVDSQDPDSEASSDESDEVQADPMLLEFQYYVTMRPHAVGGRRGQRAHDFPRCCATSGTVNRCCCTRASRSTGAATAAGRSAPSSSSCCPR